MRGALRSRLDASAGQSVGGVFRGTAMAEVLSTGGTYLTNRASAHLPCGPIMLQNKRSRNDFFWVANDNWYLALSVLPR